MKTFIYTIGAAMLVAGCSSDYTDWATPQSNTEEAQTVTLSLAQAADINFASLNTDSVQLFVPTVTSKTAAQNSYTAQIFNADKSASKTLNADSTGKVKSSELEDAVVELYTSRPTQREISLTVTAYSLINGQSIKNNAEVKAKVTPNGPEIDAKYYLTGTINGWNYNDTTYPVENNGADPYLSPEFSITLTAAQVGTGVQFKLTPASAMGSAAKCITAAVDATEGKIAYNNAGGNLEVKTATGAKYYKLTFNMIDSTYTVTVNNDPELFVTSTEYGWTTVWKSLVPVNGTLTSSTPTYWTIAYLKAGEEIRFAPQRGVGNDFSYTGVTVNDAAGAGVSNSSGNIKIANAGWYMLKVVDGTSTKSVDILTPNVYLIGETANNTWGVGTTNVFSIPTTANGEFVSPAFTQNGEVRMAVVLDGYDWWRTEFIVTPGGKIEYRGNGNDQARVKVTAGQKVYLNFTTATGEYK